MMYKQSDDMKKIRDHLIILPAQFLATVSTKVIYVAQKSVKVMCNSRYTVELYPFIYNKIVNVK